MAVRGSKRLTRLVNDILDVERLESGTFEVRPTPQDVAPIVCATVASLQLLAHDSGVSLEAVALPARAYCDADRVAQALTNLVGNAIKFSAAGGRVLITCERHGHDVLVTVRDEGQGIPPDHLDSLFEPFHRVDHSDDRDHGGTGLGLTITRSIVERHGGHIDVQSDLGAGSTFRFSLQAVDD